MRILDRYILREVLRTFLLTGVVLVTVIAFGAAIKPLANDRLLTAAQIAKYIVLATVPMLQFALPFAAGFAATVTFHRLVTDNEILAVAASGLSYRRILAPVAGFGGALLLVMVLLTQWVIPRFWGLMQSTIATDVTKIFERAISRGEPFELDRIQIYADHIAVLHELPAPEAPGAYVPDSRMVLSRGAAAELDDDGRIVTDVTFRQAVVDLYRDQGQTWIKLVARDTVRYDRRTSELQGAEQIVPFVHRLDHVLEDDPMIMTQPRLLALRRRPDTFSDVAEHRQALAAALRDADLSASIDRTLQETGGIRLRAPAPAEAEVLVRAGRLVDGELRPAPGSTILVEQRVEGTPVRRYRPGRARLEPAARERDGTARDVVPAPDLELIMEACEVEDVRHDSVNERASVAIHDIVADLPVSGAWFDRSCAELLDDARALEATAGPVKRSAERLRAEISDLQREITARLAKRYAICVTAPLLLMLGTILSLWLRESLPLTVYLWAFLPSIADLILISGGDQMLREGRAQGWLVMWSGNALLAGMIVWVYGRIART